MAITNGFMKLIAWLKMDRNAPQKKNCTVPLHKKIIYVQTYVYVFLKKCTCSGS